LQGLKRILFFSVAAVFVVPLGLLSIYKWDSSKNRGAEFGYWGDFNRTSNALASIQGISIHCGKRVIGFGLRDSFMIPGLILLVPIHSA
jgi:sugar phosphate permease